MSEETRIITRVGNYSIGQSYPEDCIKCHNAKYATVIIDGLCLDCYLEECISDFLDEERQREVL